MHGVLTILNVLGSVTLLPPQKASKTLKVGEFTRARVVGTQGHDLVAQPI